MHGKRHCTVMLRFGRSYHSLVTYVEWNALQMHAMHLYSCMQATAVQAALRQQLALGRAEVRAWPTLVQDLEAARPWRLNPSPLRIPMLLLPLLEQEVDPAQLLLEETGRRPETRKVAEVGCHQSAHVAVSGPGKRIHSSELRVAMS